MGGQGSFSEEAGNYYCQQKGITDYEIKYLLVADNVLKSVSEGLVDLGIFPIENSTSGVVKVAVYAMAKYNFNIDDMFDIDIRQNLLVRPGTKRSEITTIVSQLPALGQCREYLKNEWPGAEILEYKDTAEAARDVANGTLPVTAAAVANKSCAKLYGLEIMEENIQDLKINYTTFIVASRVKPFDTLRVD